MQASQRPNLCDHRATQFLMRPLGTTPGRFKIAKSPQTLPWDGLPSVARSEGGGGTAVRPQKPRPGEVFLLNQNSKFKNLSDSIFLTKSFARYVPSGPSAYSVRIPRLRSTARTAP
jgi:hypothetical protein